MNYSEAVAALNGRESKKIGNNTYMKRREGGAVACMLHSTDVITWKPDGSIVYNSGGWRTVTTKARMNEYGPEGISQKAGVWYIGGMVYADGCIYRDGVMSGCQAVAVVKKAARDVKGARKYAADFIAAFFAGNVPAPSNGDCWFCAFREENTGRTWGEVRGDNSEHIREHIKEGYFVPSLLVRAVDVFGVSIMAKNCFALAWAPEHKNMDTLNSAIYKTVGARQLERALYRFVKRALGMAS